MATVAQASRMTMPFNRVDSRRTASTRSSASPTSPADEVESPSLSNTSTALARFEFEAGRGSHDGTKVLMVEWEDDDTTRNVRGSWHISWEGKKTVLPAGDNRDADQREVRRLYFMLPPGTTIPSIITMTLQPGEDKSTASPIVWHTNPLPAIFPPELGASARAAGKKGVLHTIWAKKRLQVLQAEIDAESRSNVEGLGFLMAVQERDWIEQNFGVVSRPANADGAASPTVSSSFLDPSNSLLPPPLTPLTPRSPGGGRLMDKLNGLRLGTSDHDLTSTGGGVSANPLSPDSSDVAISSFAAIKGAGDAPRQAQQTQKQQRQQCAPPARSFTAQAPPASLLAQQQHGTSLMAGMASMVELAGSNTDTTAELDGTPSAAEEEKDEQDLFALPISPRSPEMTKSPFSFAGGDDRKHIDGGKAG